jgi:cellulose synthase/poly-beta-1,6-N-acetylglucosamine synthase-like glycosyltransferase
MNINPLLKPHFFISLFELLFGEYAVLPSTPFGEIIVTLNTIILSLFGFFYLYQVFLSFFSVFSKTKKYKDTDDYREYIFVTSARNEENVIGQLITSIRALDYPQDKIKIHVIADNCTDRTKEIAESMGVSVFERFSTENIGKSYALDFYFKEQLKIEKDKNFAGYIVVDTDNVYDAQYLKEINKVVVATNSDLIAAYRSSTNIGDSLWSYGTGLSFLRECTLLHKGRERLGLSSYISGTSFFVSFAKIEKEGGWNTHSLIEDIEFSAVHLYNGQRTNYAHNAIFYDEQPRGFKDSFRQRLRWVKGLLQVGKLYAFRMFKAIFARKKTMKQRFSHYESFVFLTPFPLYIIYWFIIYGILSLVNYVMTNDFQYFLQTYLFTLIDFGIGLFLFTTFMSYLIIIVDWKRIKMPWYKKIIYPLFGFLFLLSYIPMFMIAPFIKVKWKPVTHYGLKKPLE